TRKHLPNGVASVRVAKRTRERCPVRRLADVDFVEPAVFLRLPVDWMIFVTRFPVDGGLHWRETVIAIHIPVIRIVLRRVPGLDHVEIEPLFIVETLRRTALSVGM